MTPAAPSADALSEPVVVVVVAGWAALGARESGRLVVGADAVADGVAAGATGAGGWRRGFGFGFGLGVGSGGGGGRGGHYCGEDRCMYSRLGGADVVSFWGFEMRTLGIFG